MQNILHGNTIISEFWKEYEFLSEMDFKHLTVNHSIKFVYLETEANIKLMESTWLQAKDTRSRNT